jgi:hypothetical protein
VKDSFDCVMVELGHIRMLETRAGHTQSEASAPGEEFSA